MVYVQLMILAEVASMPESHLKWLRNLVREGVLHNVLEEYNLIGIDKNNGNPKVAIKLTVDIDWEKSKVYSRLKVDKEKKLNDIYNQPIIIIAKTFANIVKKEKLTVEMRCRTVENPNLKALNTLGTPKYYNPYKKKINISHKKFKELIDKKLNLVNTDTPPWREGDEVTFSAVSDITPELKTKIKYIKRNNNSLEDIKDR